MPKTRSSSRIKEQGTPPVYDDNQTKIDYSSIQPPKKNSKNTQEKGKMEEEIVRAPQPAVPPLSVIEMEQQSRAPPSPSSPLPVDVEREEEMAPPPSPPTLPKEVAHKRGKTVRGFAKPQLNVSLLQARKKNWVFTNQVWRQFADPTSNAVSVSWKIKRS